MWFIMMALLGKAARVFLGPHPPRIHMNSRLWFPCELCELYQCTMCIAHICNQPLNYQTNQYKELLEGNHMNIYCEQFPLDRTNKIYWFVGLLASSRNLSHLTCYNKEMFLNAPFQCLDFPSQFIHYLCLPLHCTSLGPPKCLSLLYFVRTSSDVC